VFWEDKKMVIAKTTMIKGVRRSNFFMRINLFNKNTQLHSFILLNPRILHERQESNNLARTVDPTSMVG